MDTRTRSPNASSNVAPTIILASGSTSWRTRLAASSTSHSVRFAPPVMDSSRLFGALERHRHRAGIDDGFLGRDHGALLARMPRRCPSWLCPIPTEHGPDVGKV